MLSRQTLNLLLSEYVSGTTGISSDLTPVFETAFAYVSLVEKIRAIDKLNAETEGLMWSISHNTLLYRIKLLTSNH